MKRKAITIGSDCSGVGTDAIALSRLGVRFENLFASDSDPHCRAVLECILDINNQTLEMSHSFTTIPTHQSVTVNGSLDSWRPDSSSWDPSGKCWSDRSEATRFALHGRVSLPALQIPD